jgi:hypothetical protein
MLNWTKVLDQISSIKIKSITDSLFRYGLYFFALGVLSGIFTTLTWVIIILFSIGGLFVIIGLGFYCYFAKKNPDYLRSESFQLKKQSIEMLGDKDNLLNPNVKELIYIASPYFKELGNGKKSGLGE